MDSNLILFYSSLKLLVNEIWKILVKYNIELRVGCNCFNFKDIY